MKSVFSFFIKSKPRAIVVALIWTAMIFAACLIPGRDIPDVDVPLADKWVHFVIFGGFTFLWLAVYQSTDVKKRVFIFLVAVLVGYAVELLQGSGITSGRSYDLTDVLADSIGAALGVVLFYLLNKKYGGPGNRN